MQPAMNAIFFSWSTDLTPFIRYFKGRQKLISYLCNAAMYSFNSRMAPIKCCLVVLLLYTIAAHVNGQQECDVFDLDCVELFDSFRVALVDKRYYNLFRLQAVFYPDSRSTPSLVKVEYNVTIANCILDPITLGWTDRTLYTVFHPDLFTKLRFQFPF